MKFNSTTLIFLLLISPDVMPQGENDHWIFGNQAHISFKTGKPEIIYSSVKMSTMEGSTSVSDADGRLLFYSDGNTVYNNEYEMMPNGQGLLGHMSSTSSAVAVPYPGQPKKYFLFCVDQNLSPDNKGLSYNIIDMNLDYGLGDIEIKNRILKRQTDEKIAVTKQCNGKDFWVVVHRAFTDSFFAYSITENGLNPLPVLSMIPSAIGEHPEIGYMKFSPSGKLLVNAQTLAERLDLYNFDKKTGHITMRASDATQYHRFKNKNEQTYYGVAFSQQENFLYVSTHESGEIYQYNLGLEPKLIFFKRYLIAKLDRQAGGLQLARDNKIYASDGYGSPFMHRIDDPGKYGSMCYFRSRFLVFQYGVLPNVGLPTLIETSLNYYNLGKDLIIQNPTNFVLDAKISNGKYQWSTGDTTRTIRISDTGGTYWVNVFDPSSCFFYTDTIRVLVYKKFLSDTPNLKNLTFCSNAFTKPIPLRSKYSGIYFIWINDNPDIGLAKTGRGDIPAFYIPASIVPRVATIKVYPVKQGYIGQEFQIDIRIKPIARVDESSMQGKEICAGETFAGRNLLAIPYTASVKWYNDNTLTGLKDSGISRIPVFKASAVNQSEKSIILVYATLDGCKSEPYYMHLTIHPIPVMKKINDVAICSGEFIPDLNLSADQPGSDFMVENPFLKGNFIGIQPNVLRMIKTPKVNRFFEMRIGISPSFMGCMGKADSFIFTIKPSPEASFTFEEDNADTGYFNSTVFLQNRSTGYSSHTWNYLGQSNSVDNSPDLQLRTNTSWPVSLSVSNTYGCVDSTGRIVRISRIPMVFMPSSFSPNIDRHNDKLYYRLFGISSYKLSIYNRWGECVFESTDTNPYWDGSLKNVKQSDGTFSWAMNAVDIDGKPLSFRGTLTVLQ